jgi:small-conductance mechanosensitive channel
MFLWATITEWVTPVSFLAGGILLGICVEVLIGSRLKKASLANKTSIATVIRPLLPGSIIILISLIGADRAIETMPDHGGGLFAGYVHKALLILGIGLVTFIVARLAVAFIKFQVKRARGTVPSISLFTNITATLVVIFGALITLQTLGISITPVLTALGVGGLAIALALQDTLSNLFAGLHIIFSGQVRQGDYIRLDTLQEGIIVDITWRNTSIRSPVGTLIIVPNTKVASAIVTNFSQDSGALLMSVPITLAYESDLVEAETIVSAIAALVQNDHSGIAAFIPTVRYSMCNEIGVLLTTTFKVKDITYQDTVRHQFLKLCTTRCKEQGIGFATVIRITTN